METPLRPDGRLEFLRACYELRRVQASTDALISALRGFDDLRAGRARVLVEGEAERLALCLKVIEIDPLSASF
jgi:hypothetical protein